MLRARARPKTYNEDVLVSGLDPRGDTNDEQKHARAPKRRRVVAVPLSVTPQRPTIVLQWRDDLSASDAHASPRKRLDLGLTFTYTMPRQSETDEPVRRAV